MSRILNEVSPFSDEVTRHTEAQLDFIMEMYADDHPEEFKFVRPGEQEPLTRAAILAAWEGRLLGKDRDRFLMSKLPSEAVFKKAEKIAGSMAALRRVVEQQAKDAAKLKK